MPIRMLRDWTDSYRFDCISPEAEVLFTRLIMKADDYGNFHGDSRIVASMCFPLGSMIVVEDALDELANRGLIMLYKVEGREYLNIPNFGQRMRNGMSRKFPAHAGESQESAADCGKARPERNKKGIEDEENRKAFEQFWAAYPRKVGKGLAEAAWANADLPQIDVILSAIRKARKSLDWQKDNGAFIPHPTTWLNQRRWEDEGMDYAALSGKRDSGAARGQEIDESAAFRWRSERYPDSLEVNPTAETYPFRVWPDSIKSEYRNYLKHEQKN